MREFPNNRVDTSIAWYKRFIAWAEQRWQSGSPTSHRLFFTFRTGVSGLLADFQDFVAVWTRLSAGASYKDLSYREISLLRLVPRDMVRATPAICISALPGTVLLLPVIFYFPRVFLTEHFWTQQQRLEFTDRLLARRRRHYDSIFGRLQQLQPQLAPDEAAASLRHVLESTQAGRGVSYKQVAASATAFGHDALQFDYLSYRHAINLSHANGLSALKLYREYRLWRLAKILFEEDRAVERANFVFSSASEAENSRLRDQFCVARGHQSCGKSPEAADAFVRSWCSATAAVADERQLAFLLHLPVLICQRAAGSV